MLKKWFIFLTFNNSDEDTNVLISVETLPDDQISIGSSRIFAVSSMQMSRSRELFRGVPQPWPNGPDAVVAAIILGNDPFLPGNTLYRLITHLMAG